MRRWTRLRFTTLRNPLQDLHHHARAVLGMRQVEQVDDLNQCEVLRGLTRPFVVVGRACEREEPALVRNGQLQTGIDHLASLFKRPLTPGRFAKNRAPSQAFQSSCRARRCRPRRT